MSDETGTVVLGTNRLGTPAHSARVKRWSSFALAVVATTAMMVGGGGPVQASPKADVSLTADALRALALRGMTSSFSATYRLSAPGFVTATMTVAQRRSRLNAVGWPSAGWMYRFTVRSPKAWLVGAEWDQNPAGKVYECAREVRPSALGVRRTYSTWRPRKYRHGVGERNVRAVRGGGPCRDALACVTTRLHVEDLAQEAARRGCHLCERRPGLEEESCSRGHVVPDPRWSSGGLVPRRTFVGRRDRSRCHRHFDQERCSGRRFRPTGGSGTVQGIKSPLEPSYHRAGGLAAGLTARVTTVHLEGASWRDHREGQAGTIHTGFDQIGDGPLAGRPTMVYAGRSFTGMTTD